jgi:nucleotide sugar dehydrogenase
MNQGQFPFPTTDQKLEQAVALARESGNLAATDDENVYAMASVILIDVNFDLDRSSETPRFAMEPFRAALASIGKRMRPNALVIVETTVPPGTCAKVVAPELADHLRQRGLPDDQFLLAHAYERVMPGDSYFDSIVNFWRVYSGHTPEAADACESFLADLVNVDEYPLRRLESTTASETAKVLENSYRAVTIALMEEWGRFAELAGIDLFEIVSAIRLRPTHSNMRTPGLGVGGYCLTKDPLFAVVAARDLFGADDMRFSFSERAVEVNAAMPYRACERLKQQFGSLSRVACCCWDWRIGPMSATRGVRLPLTSGEKPNGKGLSSSRTTRWCNPVRKRAIMTFARCRFPMMSMQSFLRSTTSSTAISISPLG